jgi:hypothetical protein
MSETRLYDVGLRFTVDDSLPPRRRALHVALEKVRAVTVEASSLEEAEAQVDQVRAALEYAADRVLRGESAAELGLK